MTDPTPTPPQPSLADRLAQPGPDYGDAYAALCEVLNNTTYFPDALEPDEPATPAPVTRSLPPARLPRAEDEITAWIRVVPRSPAVMGPATTLLDFFDTPEAAFAWVRTQLALLDDPRAVGSAEVTVCVTQTLARACSAFGDVVDEAEQWAAATNPGSRTA